MPRPRRDIPWLDTRDNGTYYAFWWDASARRTLRESLHTKDPQQATIRFARFLVEGSKNTRTVGDAGLTVRQALDWYDREHVEPNVVDKVRQRAAIQHLVAFLGDKLVKDVDIFECRAYTKARMAGATAVTRKERGRKNLVGSAPTIRRELGVLVAAANHAVRFHKHPKTELPTVEFPAVVVASSAPWLTKKQLARAIDNAEGDLRDFIVLAYYTAARRRSIQFLRKDQVDLQHSRIDLNPAGRLRTKKRRPIVPIFPEIRPTIERLMAESATEFVFETPRDFYRPFVELLADIGIEAHPHMLRHSRATHMLMDGEDPYKVAKLLGDTLATVERVYGHASVEYLDTKSTLGVA